MEEVQNRVENFLQTYPLLSLDEMLSHNFSDPTHSDPIWKLTQNKEENPPLCKNLIQLFLYIRNLHKQLFQSVEGKETCRPKMWDARIQHPDKELFGGGIMSVIREQILEKAAVNMSIVHGPKYPALEGEYASKPFVAGGVSLISHPRNPYAPIMHMNIRCIEITENDKVTRWIGGGADLTPMLEFDEDTNLFHSHMQQACEKNSRIADYAKFKKLADDYFFIPHRKETRGVGGVFFDFVPLENDQDISLLLDIGQHAAQAYANILAKRTMLPYDDSLLEKHLYWRGRYAEFNLAYDRGTRFGLLTGGNSEAILCSLPPTVKW